VASTVGVGTTFEIRLFAAAESGAIDAGLLQLL